MSLLFVVCVGLVAIGETGLLLFPYDRKMREKTYRMTGKQFMVTRTSVGFLKVVLVIVQAVLPIGVVITALWQSVGSFILAFGALVCLLVQALTAFVEVVRVLSCPEDMIIGRPSESWWLTEKIFLLLPVIYFWYLLFITLGVIK